MIPNRPPIAAAAEATKEPAWFNVRKTIVTKHKTAKSLPAKARRNPEGSCVVMPRL